MVPRLLIGRTGVDERSVPCDHRAGTPSKVQADLEHVVVCLDVDWYREGGRGRDERGRLGAEVVVVVLDKTGEPISVKAYSPPIPTVQPPKVALVVETTSPVALAKPL